MIPREGRAVGVAEGDQGRAEVLPVGAQRALREAAGGASQGGSVRSRAAPVVAAKTSVKPLGQVRATSKGCPGVSHGGGNASWTTGAVAALPNERPAATTRRRTTSPQVAVTRAPAAFAPV